MFWILTRYMKGCTRKMEEEKEKKNGDHPKKSFRWVLSIIGEVLLVIPIAVILLLFGMFIQERQQETQDSSVWAEYVWEEEEDDRQFPMGFDAHVYEDDAGRL